MRNLMLESGRTAAGAAHEPRHAIGGFLHQSHSFAPPPHRLPRIRRDRRLPRAAMAQDHALHAAGAAATLALSLGGRSDGAPLAVAATVEKLTDGRFTLTGPMGRGNPADLGPCAPIRVAAGVRAVVVSRKMQAHDQAVFTQMGVEPAAQRILAVKPSVHFRADFQPIAAAVLVAAAPGPVVADPATLPFTSLRPGDNRRF